MGNSPSASKEARRAEYERLATKRALGDNYFEKVRPDGTIIYGDKRAEKRPGYYHGHTSNGQTGGDGTEFHRGPHHKLGAGAMDDFRTGKERTRRWRSGS